MIQHPEILQKAQKELDSVVGNSRLPTFSDRANLPYVNAVVNETLRLSSPVPLGQYTRLYLNRCTCLLRDISRSPAPHHGGQRVQEHVHSQGHARLRQQLVRVNRTLFIAQHKLNRTPL